jgi:hypothetical protein
MTGQGFYCALPSWTGATQSESSFSGLWIDILTNLLAFESS